MPGSGESHALDEYGIAGITNELRTWIARARWFAHRQHEGLSVELDDVAVLRERDPLVLLTLWRVQEPGQAPALYSVPLGVRASPHQISEYGPEHLVGETEGLLVYDALADPESAAELWHLLAERRTLDTREGRLVAHGDAEIDTLDLDQIHLLGAEQSNSALVRGHRDFLKWLRRIEHGPSVELEMTGVLHERHFRYSPDRLGHVAYYRGDGPPALQALLMTYLNNSTQGWKLALTSLRDLYADAEELTTTSARQRQELVDNQGSSFVAEAARLGEVTGELHATLTDPALRGEMAPSRITSNLLLGWAATMTAELDTLLRSRNPVVAPLAEKRDLIAARFSDLRHIADGGQAIRIHGDYHLGQVVRTNDGWHILDFEGEPNRTLAERRQRWSPLRDVASMLRSFDYAAAAALAERMPTSDPRWDEMIAQGGVWSGANRDAFWAAYLRQTANADLLPDPGAALALRRAFELQKAVYEVGYELGYRPQWATIPLRFLMASS